MWQHVRDYSSVRATTGAQHQEETCEKAHLINVPVSLPVSAISCRKISFQRGQVVVINRVTPFHFVYLDENTNI